MKNLLKQVCNNQEKRLDVLEEIIENMHNNMGEILGIIEEIKYLEYLKNDLKNYKDLTNSTTSLTE